MSEEMRSRLWGILKDPKKRAILSWLGGAAGLVAVSLWTFVIFVVVHNDVHLQAIAQILTIVLAFATAAFYATYYLVLRVPLAKMRDAIDATSSDVGPATAGTNRAVADTIEYAKRRSQLAVNLGAYLILVTIGLNLLIYYDCTPAIVLDALPPTVINAGLQGLVLGILVCVTKARLETTSARLVVEARSKIIASLGEGHFSDADKVQYARGERDEER